MGERIAIDWVYDEKDAAVFVDPRGVANWLRSAIEIMGADNARAMAIGRWIDEVGRRLDDFATTVAIDIADFGRGTGAGELYRSRAHAQLRSLRDEIAAVRAQLRRAVNEGDLDLAGLAGARLSGLLYAGRIFGGGIDDLCIHATHTTAGLDDNGKTIWLCTNCGERA